jgi:hypothetical protein
MSMRLARTVVSLVLAGALTACGSPAGNTPAGVASTVAAPAQTPTPPSPTPSPTPTPDAALLELATADGWRPVPPDPLISRTQWEDVTWTGERFLAIGGGVLIASDDGIRWEPLEPVPGASVSAVGMLGDSVRVAAMLGDEEVTVESSDARTWVRLPGNAAVPGRHTARSDRGWVRVGATAFDGPCASECPSGDGRSWTSADGLSWRRSRPQATLDGAELRSVVDAHGIWLAAGSTGGVGALWTSDDGLTWSPVTDATLRPVERAASVEPLAFARVGQTLVLTGYEWTQGSGRVRAWWSTDGRTWSEAQVDGAGPYGQLNDVWSTADEVLATGWSEGCRAWSTRDGRSWACIAADPLITVLSPWGIAASPRAEVLVGMTDNGWDEESEEGPPGSIWWRPRP